MKYNSSDGAIGGSEEYDDNLGMVEFGGKIRFYYMFRPFVYVVHLLNLSAEYIFWI